MATNRGNEAAGIRGRLARFSKFGKAAFIAVLVLFIVCACTIGGFNSPGKGYYAAADSSAVFYLDYNENEEGEKSLLREVYVNIGSVYTSVGDDFELTFRNATASGKYTAGKWRTTYMGDVTFGNIWSASESGISGANYNWVKVFDYGGLSENSRVRSNYCLIEVQFPERHDMLVNEVVFVDDDGNVIPAYTTVKDAQPFFDSSYWPSYRDLFNGNDKTDEYGSFGSPENLVDGQGRYSRGTGVYSNFTQDEMYTLIQIDNILLGTHNNVEGIFTADVGSGPLAVLFPLLGTLIFGKSVFGLRIFSVLFTAAIAAFAWFFGKRLFRSEGFALLFVLLFAGGGLALTVGRLGVALPCTAFFTFAAFYFMYKFYTKGFSPEAPVKSAAGSVLASGIFFALAFAADPKSVFAGLGLLVLFVLGMVRLYKSYAAQCAKARRETSAKNAGEASEQVIRENLAACEEAVADVRSKYVYDVKLAVLFFILTFIAAAFAFTVVAALPSVLTYVKLYDAPESPALGIFSLVGKALKDAFTPGNLTAYSTGSEVSAFGWFIALKGATLFSASTDTLYCALNAQLNLAVAVSALVGFLFTSAYAVLYAVTGGKKGPYATKYSRGILRAYVALLAGLVSSLLQYAFTGGASAAHGFLFDIFYVAFVPLMFYTSYVHDGSRKKPVFGIPMNTTAKVMSAVCAVYVLVFALSLPMYFAIPVVPLAATVCFGWTTFLNNGFYRI